jgi:hypothetical protein
VPYVVVAGFNAAAGTNLTAYTPAVGGAPAKVIGATADIVISAALRARGDANALARYVFPAVPESPDYDATGIIRRVDGRGEAGVMARASASADTGYTLGYVHSAGQWQLRRFNAGTQTVLGTFGQTLTDGQDVTARLQVRGTGATVTLRALLDGVERIAAQDSAAGRIVAAGQVGLRINAGTNTLQNTRGYHVGRLTAFALPVDARPRAPKPAPGPLATRILAKTLAERAAERAAVLAEAGAPPGWQVTRGGTPYTLSLPQGLSLSGGALVIPQVACSPAPLVPLDPGGYRFVNPPVQVPDGTVREETDSQGEPTLIANFAENAVEALRQIVADCVLRGLPA